MGNAQRVKAVIVLLLPSLLLAPGPSVSAQGLPGVKLTTVLQATTTAIGQPIEFPHFRDQVTAVLAEIAPGGQTDRHQHPAIVVTYVLDGALAVDIEGFGQKVYPAGQAFVEPVNTWHNVTNRGSTPAEVLFVFAGEQGKPDTVRPAGFRQVGMRHTPVLQATTTPIGQPILFPLFHNQVTLVLAEFAPGAENPRHQHPVPEFVYMLEGTLTVEVEGHGKTVLTAGRGGLETVNTWHRAFNGGTVPAKFVAVFFTEQGKPVTVR